MSTSPKIARKWLPAEDSRLKAVLGGIASGADINWHQVASHIPGRNNKECRKRWIYALMPSLRKGPWKEEEDALLLEGVRLHGLKWPLVSQTVRTRQPDQCSRRWHESLNPSINHGRWSLFEDQILREAVSTYGRRWTEIVERYFPNRTPIAAKKRYAQCVQPKAKSSHSGSDYEEEARAASASPKLDLKREDADTNTNQLLWCVPDHSQSFPSQAKSAYSFPAPHFLDTPAASNSSIPLANRFSTHIDMTTALPFTAPTTPLYSPGGAGHVSMGNTLPSAVGSVGGVGDGGAAAQYSLPTPMVTGEETGHHIWIPSDSQSAYSGSPFVFSEQGYFDPHYNYTAGGAMAHH